MYSILVQLHQQNEPKINTDIPKEAHKAYKSTHLQNVSEVLKNMQKSIGSVCVIMITSIYGILQTMRTYLDNEGEVSQMF